MSPPDPTTAIATASGRTVDLYAPDPAQIALEDIAQALALTRRFAHAARFTSLAEHALLVSQLVEHDHDDDPELVEAALRGVPQGLLL
jgi:hypothetical protein